MASEPLQLEGAHSLGELVESHLQVLFDKLARPHTLDDIEADLATLNDLIYSYKRKDELLEKLIDSATPEENRRHTRYTKSKSYEGG
jgi:hypothetical protein